MSTKFQTALWMLLNRVQLSGMSEQEAIENLRKTNGAWKFTEQQITALRHRLTAGMDAYRISDAAATKVAK